jgi:hypothetical protein
MVISLGKATTRWERLGGGVWSSQAAMSFFLPLGFDARKDGLGLDQLAARPAAPLLGWPQAKVLLAADLAQKLARRLGHGGRDHLGRATNNLAGVDQYLAQLGELAGLLELPRRRAIQVHVAGADHGPGRLQGARGLHLVPGLARGHGHVLSAPAQDQLFFGQRIAGRIALGR